MLTLCQRARAQKRAASRLPRMPRMPLLRTKALTELAPEVATPGHASSECTPSKRCTIDAPSGETSSSRPQVTTSEGRSPSWAGSTRSLILRPREVREQRRATVARLEVPARTGRQVPRCWNSEPSFMFMRVSGAAQSMVHLLPPCSPYAPRGRVVRLRDRAEGHLLPQLRLATQAARCAVRPRPRARLPLVAHPLELIQIAIIAPAVPGEQALAAGRAV
mmetsp:Transcript_147896/g.368524  ORF Transcript_147896/g.368524 Transcript_147896/m.368524 type:complete len:220 (+) Transcript_147896:70-729(+)